MIGQNFFTCVTFPKKLTQRRQFRQDYRFPFWGGEEKLKSETFRGYIAEKVARCVLQPRQSVPRS